MFHEHSHGISQKDLSTRFNKVKVTIERWYLRQHQEQAKELMNTSCPIVLGIDEHFFSKKQGFATTLWDLKKHKIFDIVKGRSEADLSSYLSSLVGTGRVRVVCMDLSSTYRSVVKKNFPMQK